MLGSICAVTRVSLLLGSFQWPELGNMFSKIISLYYNVIIGICYKESSFSLHPAVSAVDFFSVLFFLRMYSTKNEQRTVFKSYSTSLWFQFAFL